MGLVSLSELQMWSRVANGRSHTSFLSTGTPNGTLGLVALDDGTVDWLQTTVLCI